MFSTKSLPKISYTVFYTNCEIKRSGGCAMSGQLYLHVNTQKHVLVHPQTHAGKFSTTFPDSPN